MSSRYPENQIKTGSRIGHYVIVQKIADGGMGTVYKALEPMLERFVAIKVLHRDLAADPQQLANFRDEARSVASLRHGNIVPVHFIGQQGSLIYFAMAYIEGQTLEQVVDSGQILPPPVAKGYMEQAISALEHATRYDIVHLDIKPSNFLIDAYEVVMLTDFGLAQKASQASRDGREMFGTPSYCSPEHIFQHETDLRTDIYSLGATFFHLMTGRPPFEGETNQDICRGHAFQPFPEQVAVDAGLPRGWVNLLQKMMEKEPPDRFQNYTELREALEDVESFRHRKDSFAPPDTKRIRALPDNTKAPELMFGILPPETASEDGRYEIRKTYTAAEVEEALVRRDKILGLNLLLPEIAEMCQPHDGDLGDIVNTMARLPALKATIFELAEFYAGMRGEKVPDEATAVEVVGMGRCHNLGLLCLMLKKKWQPSKPFDWRCLWQHMVSTGLLVEMLYEHLGLTPTGLEFAAGALHDVGKLLYSEMFPNTYPAAMIQAMVHDQPLHQKEKEIYGLSHAEIAELWLRRHKIRRALSDIILYHDNPIVLPETSDPTGIGLGRFLGTSFNSRLLAHAVCSANHLAKQLHLGFSGSTWMDQCQWEAHFSTQYLWQARTRENLDWKSFVKHFTVDCADFPMITAAYTFGPPADATSRLGMH
ncbi:MAG: protein kinase [Candidatus Methylacidiphilales bacterium]|nr:protein kinase [Candidatus Methylacidiphilales bacterium]